MTTADPLGAEPAPGDTAPREEPLQEFVDSAGQTLQADTRSSVLRGVKLLGLSSRNGRRYLEPALGKAIGLYEGSKVNVNHHDRGPLAPRDYRDRIGVVRNVRLRPGEGLFGDLHYNPRHPLAEQLAWDAHHAPENLGLSHNVLARTRASGNEVVVEAITRVQSVDLVADPATTSGLYEHAAVASTAPNVAADEKAIASLREEVEQLRERLVREARRSAIERALLDEGVGAEERGAVLTERFARQLIDAATDEEAVAMIEDRVRVWRREPPRRPQSQEGFALSESRPVGGYAEFVAAVTSASR